MIANRLVGLRNQLGCCFSISGSLFQVSSITKSVLSSLSKTPSLAILPVSYLQNKYISDLFRKSGVLREQRLTLINELVMNRLMAANREELLCRVIIAKPLDDKLRNELDLILQQFSKKGEKLNIKYSSLLF
ncbi:unnamed protein product [Rotaria sp. Silwood2]|nr:unnamed protein product [Rotaria sp. Silwood2]CAF2762809.1 unnamed protein product [Rotaria sp. Silwood2]CAF2846425.1 unnamed protein product [Rotaria sp. Silwood2]CAF3383088.1 unnamed protein product [Rotaria sp. Silwood2]CAF4424489.1 unnamed protein product [Rotaria sp. Silwood2]